MPRKLGTTKEKCKHRLIEKESISLRAKCITCGPVRIRNISSREKPVYRCLNYSRELAKLNKERRKQKRRSGKPCEICREIKPLVLDHNHEHGYFRGWICSSCNSLLGFSFDNKEILNSAVTYLENRNNFVKSRTPLSG